MDEEPEGEPLWSGGWDDMTVPVPLAASMLCVSPYAVGQLIEAGHLDADRHGQFRFVRVASLFAYRRKHWSPERAAQYTVALDDAAALDQAGDQLAG